MHPRFTYYEVLRIIYTSKYFELVYLPTQFICVECGAIQSFFSSRGKPASGNFFESNFYLFNHGSLVC